MESLTKSAVKLMRALLCRPGMTVRMLAMKTDSLNPGSRVRSWMGGAKRRGFITRDEVGVLTITSSRLRAEVKKV